MTANLLRRAFRLLNPRSRWKMTLAAAVNLLIGMMEAAGLGLVFPLLQGLVNPSSTAALTLPLIGDVKPENGNAIVLGAAILALFIIKNLAAIVLLRWQFRFLNRAEADLYNRLAGAYLHAPFAMHLERNPAELIRNVSGTGSIISGFLMPMLSLVGELAVVVASLSVIVYLQPTVAIPLMAGLALTAWLFQRVTRGRLDHLAQDLLSVSYEMLKWLNQGLGSVRETIVLGRQDHFVATIAKHRERNGTIRREQLFLQALPRYYLELMLLAGLSSVAVFLGLTRSPAETAATMGLLGAVGLRLLPSLNRIMVNAQQMRASAPIVDIVSTELAQLALPDDLHTSPPTVQTKLTWNGQLQLRGVTFHYPGRKDPALQHIDLDIPRGASVGIIGSSGAGKSTLVDVILGLFQPQEGCITVGGNNIQADLPSWRRQLGYVPQTVYLADDNLRRNIAFGLADSAIDNSRIAEVISLARLDDVVSQLPEGLDTMVGDRGVRLSGGQRQRIGIARALYQDPPILVLDEATSALDSQTESEIVQTIDALAGVKTLLVIAHRLSTIRHCDFVVLMDRGAVKAVGNLSSLAADDEELARLVRLAALDTDDQRDNSATGPAWNASSLK